MIKIKELEDFVKNTEFGDESFQLDQSTLINNQRQFAESHLQVLKANSGNKTIMPYYKRLVRFYKLIKKNEKFIS